MEMSLVSKVTFLLSLFTILAQILIVLGLLNLLTSRRVKVLNNLFMGAGRFVFVVPVVAMLGSLFFSEVAHYTPCVLCWYQRIVMYPQAIILSIAAFKKDKSFNFYSLVLSAIGAVISFYHHLIQVGFIHEVVPCTTVPQAVDCARKTVLIFGYITIPLMAFSAFTLIIVLQLHNLKASKKK